MAFLHEFHILGALEALLSLCSLQISFLSGITSRYSTELESAIVLPLKEGRLNCAIFGVLVKIQFSVFSGLTVRP